MSDSDGPNQNPTIQWDPNERLCPECGRTFPAGTERCPDDGTALQLAHPFARDDSAASPQGEAPAPPDLPGNDAAVQAPPPENASGAGEGPTDGGDDEDRLVGTTLLDKWRVVRKLGAGSFGSVYEVEDIKGGWREALKVLGVDRLTGADADNARQRFLREAQIMKRLGTESSHIVGLSTYDEDLESGLVFLTMEFVEGRTLADVVGEDGPMELERALRLSLQVCEALMVAHEDTDRVVHRDLKLENIMLTTDRAGEETTKILDFGIAKIAEKETDSRLTTVGTLGTPGYAAPEQLRAEEVDGRSDLFAFGVILYGLMTGRDPWLGFPANEPTTQIYDLMVKSERGEVTPMRSHGANVPPDMEAIVLKLLRRDPAERFQSARELRAALREVQQTSATSGAVLHVRTEEPGIAVEVRSGRKTVAEGKTPLLARGLDGGSYKVRIRDERFEPVETSVEVAPEGRGDVTLVARPRASGFGATLRRNRGVAAAAVVLILGGAGALVMQPWGTTLDLDGLRERAAAGQLSQVRVAGSALVGTMERGALPRVSFRTPVSQDQVATVVEDLVEAGVDIDPRGAVLHLLDQAAGAQADRRYFGSEGDDVRTHAERALALEPNNAAARALLWKVAERMAWDAQAEVSDGRPDAAADLVAACLALVPEHARCTEVQGTI